MEAARLKMGRGAVQMVRNQVRAPHWMRWYDDHLLQGAVLESG